MTHTNVQALVSAGFQAPTILEQADAFDVAGDAYEEVGSEHNARALHGWAGFARAMADELAGKNPRIVRVGLGMGVVYDEPEVSR